MKVLGLSLFIMIFLNGFAFCKESTKWLCGKRDGTAGNAYLVDKKNAIVLELAIQGGSQILLEQLDSMIKPIKPGGESGSQNGSLYCAQVLFSKDGSPLKILSAKRSSKF